MAQPQHYPPQFPPQYAEGKAYFRYIEVAVDQRVLIPRPETEELVTVAFELLDSEVEHPLIADICTGSGCIACSVAYEIPGARVVATDISPDACEVARTNAANLGKGEIEIFEGNLGNPIPQEYLGHFDLVISNPPYIPSGIIPTLDNMVKDYEPMLALDGGEDGLRLLAPLLKWCAKALKPGAPFAIELHEESLEDARKQAETLGFQNLQIHKDLAGRPRILTGHKS